MKKNAKYKRILLKLSGEALAGKKAYGISSEVLRTIAEDIKELRAAGVQVAIVLGGGNIFRGLSATHEGFDRVAGDYMGMLATVIISLALQDALEKIGVITRIMSAIQSQELAEPYIRRKATRHLEKGRVVILAAGTGNPFFTTDTAASLRAIELQAEVILKATKVDGVYCSDPVKNKNAKKYDNLTYIDVINKNLKIMDATAITLCMDNKLPIIIFNLTKRGNIRKIIEGEKVGTLVSGGLHDRENG